MTSSSSSIAQIGWPCFSPRSSSITAARWAPSISARSRMRRRSPCQRSWIQPRSTETVSCGFDFTMSPMRSSDFGLDLAVRLRHLDHLRGCAVAGHVRHLEAALRGGRRRALGGTGTAPAPARLLDAEHLAHHRPHHAHEHDQGEERDDPGLDQPQQVLLGRAEQRGEERRLDGRRRDRRLGKAQVHDLELVAAVLVEPDRGADERGDAVELLLRARLVGRLAAGGPARRRRRGGPRPRAA